MIPKRRVPKGWFETRKNHGDRTLAQQMIGLGALRKIVKGKTILDVGCAEGLIGFELLDYGALLVHGVEIVPRQVYVARAIAIGRPVGTCGFIIGDVNTFKPTFEYDIVLMLGILHKLEDPEASCRRLVVAAKQLCVIRIPPSDVAHIIINRNGLQYNLDTIMVSEGFKLKFETTSAYDEVTLFYIRK